MGVSINFFDPKIFKNPTKFLPERWIPKHELYDGAEKKDFYAYLPFSAGSRSCIGQNLALIFVKTILIELLGRYEFKVKNNLDELCWINGLNYKLTEPLMLELKLK